MVARAWEMESCWNAVRVSPHASTRLGWGRVSGCGDCAVSGAGRKAPKAISDRVRVWERDISFTIPPLRREARPIMLVTVYLRIRLIGTLLSLGTAPGVLHLWTGVAQQHQAKPGDLGFTDTPILPGIKWH